MNTLKALAFVTAEAGTSYIVGAAVDTLLNKVSFLSGHPLRRVLVQFPLGFVMLGEVLRGLGEGFLYKSPVHDGMMMVFFYQGQPTFWQSVEFLNVEAQEALASFFASSKPQGS